MTIGWNSRRSKLNKRADCVVKVDDNAKIEFNRTAIATVIVDKPVEAAAETSNEKKGFSLFGKKANKDKIAEAIKEKDTSSKKAGAKKDE